MRYEPGSTFCHLQKQRTAAFATTSSKQVAATATLTGLATQRPLQQLQDDAGAAWERLCEHTAYVAGLLAGSPAKRYRTVGVPDDRRAAEDTRVQAGTKHKVHVQDMAQAVRPTDHDGDEAERPTAPGSQHAPAGPSDTENTQANTTKEEQGRTSVNEQPSTELNRAGDKGSIKEQLKAMIERHVDTSLKQKALAAHGKYSWLSDFCNIVSSELTETAKSRGRACAEAE